LYIERGIDFRIEASNQCFGWQWLAFAMPRELSALSAQARGEMRRGFTLSVEVRGVFTNPGLTLKISIRVDLRVP
jgi:hypothetical protein